MDQKTPAPETREPCKKAYTPPRVIHYGRVADIVGGNTGMMSDGAPGNTRFCRIAETLYGIHDHRTALLRRWIAEIYCQRRNGWQLAALYARYGQTMAAIFRESPGLRRTVRVVFDRMLVRAGWESLTELSRRRRVVVRQ